MKSKDSFQENKELIASNKHRRFLKRHAKKIKQNLFSESAIFDYNRKILDHIRGKKKEGKL
jgi:hypothetical protein